ncbi:MAG: hypothetical protein U0S49_01400 [Rhodospirillales bacterium]|nr:hypothetical protein [Rhodospirillales bacterium]
MAARNVLAPGEQAQRDHRVRLAAAHGLLQLEHRLVGAVGEALQPLVEQNAHPLGDEVLLEEGARPLGRRVDHLGDVLDLLAHGEVQRHRVQFAGNLDGKRHASPRA